MTSNMPPAAVPGPDGVPDWEKPGSDDELEQPDPFGEPTDDEGRPDDADPKHDPRAQ